MADPRGIYVSRTSYGITSVQVVYGSGGNEKEFPMDPVEYKEKKIDPPIESLPTAQQYHRTKLASRQLVHEDWAILKGTPAEVSIGPETFKGVLKGLKEDAVVALPDGRMEKPWLLETETKDVCFSPSDRNVKIRLL